VDSVHVYELTSADATRVKMLARPSERTNDQPPGGVTEAAPRTYTATRRTSPDLTLDGTGMTSVVALPFEAALAARNTIGVCSVLCGEETDEDEDEEEPLGARLIEELDELGAATFCT
jgi:hypothetical protein